MRLPFQRLLGQFYRRISTRLALAFMVSTLIPPLVIGIYSMNVSSQSLLDRELSALSERTSALTQGAESFLLSAESDVRFLAGSNPMQTLLRLRSAGADEVMLAAAIGVVEEEFLAFSNSRGSYYQIRYLDETGQEVARVDSDGKTAKIIPKKRLQNKGSRYYFADSVDLPKGALFVSPLDLNRERGKVEVPHKPVIRYAAPVHFADGRKAGIVITNVDGNKILKPLADAILVDAMGYYLAHPDVKKAWGSSRDLDTGHNLNNDFPQLAAQLMSGEDGSITTEEQAISFNKVSVPGSKHTWTMIAQRPKEELLAGVVRFRLIFAAILAGVLLVAIAIAAAVGLTVTRPLGRLHQVVNEISAGNRDARARLKTGDELQELGDALDGMMDESGQLMKTQQEENETLNDSVMAILRSVSQLGKGDLTIEAPVNADITGALGDAINQMSDGIAKTLAHVNNASAQVVAGSEHARDATAHSRETVLNTVRGMNEIRSTIQETAKRIKRLGERSQEISGIVKLIDTIAERTNVLALNANMQAAQAGEAGRGFMVVAAEVQRLAESAKDATDQIAKLISGIQVETGEAMHTMDRSIEEVVEGSQLAEKGASEMKLTDDAVEVLNALGAQLQEAVSAFKLPDGYVSEGGTDKSVRAAAA